MKLQNVDFELNHFNQFWQGKLISEIIFMLNTLRCTLKLHGLQNDEQLFYRFIYIFRSLHIGSVESLAKPKDQTTKAHVKYHRNRPQSRRQSSSMQSNQEDLLGMGVGFKSLRIHDIMNMKEQM